MKRLTVLVLSICTTAILLTTGASSNGWFAPQADDLESLGFGLCERKPCFLNIVPGETSWADAVATLKPYPPIQFTKTDGILFDGQTVLVESYSRSRQSLDVIRMWTPQRNFSVGAAIRELGIPCGVSFYSVTANQCAPPGTCSGLLSMEIRYESLILQVNLRMDGTYPREIEITRLDPRLPVRSLVLVNPAKFQATATAFCHISPTMDERVFPGAAHVDTPWLGFTSTRHYMTYARRETM